MELLEPGQSVDFVWDDLAQERRLVVCVVGECFHVSSFFNAEGETICLLEKRSQKGVVVQ